MDSKAIVAVVALGGLAALAMAGGGGSSPQPAPARPEPPKREPPYPTGLRRPDSQGELLDLGWDLLQNEHSPIMAFITSENRPCSHMVAAWAIALSGESPRDRRDWTDFNAWRNLNPELWDRINLTDHSRPWDNIPALSDFIDGVSSLVKRKVGIQHAAPALTPERWHFVQSWDRAGDEVVPKPEGPDSGHHYLVWMGKGGDMFKVHSSVRDGYRVEAIKRGERWYKNGSDLRVATLPSTMVRANA